MSRIETIGNATLYLGDCLDVLKTLPTNSVDSVVCDQRIYDSQARDRLLAKHAARRAA